MKESVSIDNFSTFELNSIIEHLRLGNQHIKKYLTEDQYKDFLNCIEREGRDEVFASIQRGHLGNVALMLNTIVSSTFGSWLAMAGVMGFGSVSLSTLLITISVAFTLSLLGALSAYRMLNNQAREELISQDIINFQIKLVDKINEAKSRDIIKAAKDLKNLFEYDLDYDPESLDSIVSWAKKTEFVTDNKKYCFKPKSMDDPSFIVTLSEPTLEPRVLTVEKTSLFQGKLLRALVELLSITIGGFASTFVYTTGIPDIVRQLGHMQLYAILISPMARVGEMMLAVCLTAFFIFCYLYTYRKNIRRDYVLNKSKQIFVKKEAIMLENDIVFAILQDFERMGATAQASKNV